MLNSPYRAFVSAGFVWGCLLILLAFGSFIESCDNKPRVSSHVNLASTVDSLPPQPSPPADPIPLVTIPPVKPQQLPDTP
jgi:hypothetical protein